MSTAKYNKCTPLFICCYILVACKIVDKGHTMKKTVEIECNACHGTGLYQGYGERHGAAVICCKCNGLGKVDFSYTEFEGRKEMPGVTRVFKPVPFFPQSGIDETTKDGSVLHFSRFGVSYEEWKNGSEPLPMEELYCPYEYNGRKTYPCSRCKEGCMSSVGEKCHFYSDKAKCWEEWHKTNN